MDMHSFAQITQLAKLLNPNKDEDDEPLVQEEEDDDIERKFVFQQEYVEKAATYNTTSSSATPFSPGSIGAPVKSQPKQKPTKQSNSTSIWDADEIETVASPIGNNSNHSVKIITIKTISEEDPRETPQYEIHLKQTLQAEDIYLGLSDKNPSSNTADEFALTIKMPKCSSIKEIQLDVYANNLNLTSKH